MAVGGLLYVRKRVPYHSLVAYHEVAGYLLSVIGTLYAVLLGFVVVDAMTQVQEARLTVEKEADAIANVFLAADGFPQAERDRIQELSQRYVKLVIEDEWQAMARSAYSRAAFDVSWLLWKEGVHFRPKTEAEQSLHQCMLEELSNLSDARRARLLKSRHGVAPILWLALITGGIFTLVFTYFFGVQNIRVQIVMTVLVAFTLALNVMLVVLFGRPFAGDLAVQPEAFRLDQEIFNAYLKDCR
ncbi:MAG TPA: hypothetical protein V6D17_13785 [Candidatus Obscuribacterales bacterium]